MTSAAELEPGRCVASCEGSTGAGVGGGARQRRSADTRPLNPRRDSISGGWRLSISAATRRMAQSAAGGRLETPARGGVGWLGSQKSRSGRAPVQFPVTWRRTFAYCSSLEGDASEELLLNGQTPALFCDIHRWSTSFGSRNLHDCQSMVFLKTCTIIIQCFLEEMFNQQLDYLIIIQRVLCRPATMCVFGHSLSGDALKPQYRHPFCIRYVDAQLKMKCDTLRVHSTVLLIEPEENMLLSRLLVFCQTPTLFCRIQLGYK